MTLAEIKDRIAASAAQSQARIIALGEELLRMPEIGYREHATSARLREEFARLAIPCGDAEAVTGFRATLGGRASEANIGILGEMDALVCPGHVHASVDGYAHACGHHAQLAAMLGCAIILRESGVMEHLDGDVTFFAVPAEEFIDLDFRRSLRDAGSIRYYGGKQELIARGAFDAVDMAMMLHAQPDAPDTKVYMKGYNLGFCAKKVTFRGKAAHGSRPYEGTNALNAAALAILGIHSNRETFREEERIRIHPIITKGGDVVNSVPDEVCVEMYVRGASADAIRKGCDAVDRAVHGAAQMIGVSAEIENTPGYLPIAENELLNSVFAENAVSVLGKEAVVFGQEITGSTDVGDLSNVLPVIQPSVGGFLGNLHGNSFTVADPETAYVLPAKLMALTVADLLYGGAESAKRIRDTFVPSMTKKQYISYLEGEKT